MLGVPLKELALDQLIRYPGNLDKAAALAKNLSQEEQIELNAAVERKVEERIVQLATDHDDVARGDVRVVRPWNRVAWYKAY